MRQALKYGGSNAALLVFPAFVLMFIHSVFTDPLLSNGKVDLLDGGRIFVEICCAISLATWAVRIHLRGRGLRPQRRNADRSLI